MPHGADIFWKILDEEFNHEEWKIRFAAVEKTTLLFRQASSPGRGIFFNMNFRYFHLQFNNYFREALKTADFEDIVLIRETIYPPSLIRT